MDMEKGNGEEADGSWPFDAGGKRQKQNQTEDSLCDAESAIVVRQGISPIGPQHDGGEDADGPKRGGTKFPGEKSTENAPCRGTEQVRDRQGDDGRKGGHHGGGQEFGLGGDGSAEFRNFKDKRPNGGVGKEGGRNGCQKAKRRGQKTDLPFFVDQQRNGKQCRSLRFYHHERPCQGSQGPVSAVHGPKEKAEGRSDENTVIASMETCGDGKGDEQGGQRAKSGLESIKPECAAQPGAEQWQNAEGQCHEGIINIPRKAFGEKSYPAKSRVRPRRIGVKAAFRGIGRWGQIIGVSV